MTYDPSKNSAQGRTSRFATTHWSVVLAAGKPESTDYEPALETLCRTYWFPLYAYLRRQGYSSDKAEDCTQAFFAGLLDKHGLRLADPKRGKFRSFLLTAFKHFLANERAYARAQKRGGDRNIISMNLENAENRYSLEPSDELSPDKIFERSWALTVLERTMTRLHSEAVNAKKQKQFDLLKVYLTAEKNSVPYQKIATEIRMTEGAVRVAVHRLRRRYRRLLREEISQTVASEDQIDEEIRELFAALAR
jgi:RNA polymerase sigma factor (sigma-70 family)